MSREVEPRGVGRPSILTDETEKTILQAVRHHQTFPVAAELAGISRQTLHNWMMKGATAKNKLAAGAMLSDLNALERRCLEFLDRLGHAESQARAVAVHGVVEAGLHRQTEVRTHKKFVGLDQAGQPILITETTEIERPPDPKVLQWWLERRDPAYRPKAEVEGELSLSVRAANLADKIRAYQGAIPADSRDTPEAGEAGRRALNEPEDGR